MMVVLASGEALHGVIEWYDSRCIKINRVGEPNLLVSSPRSQPSRIVTACHLGGGQQ